MKKNLTENNEKIKNIGGVVTGLLVGSVVGTAVGILMAPQSGARTRRKIKHDVIGAQRKAILAFDDAKDKAREVVQDVSENVKGTVTERKKSLTKRFNRLNNKIKV